MRPVLRTGILVAIVRGLGALIMLIGTFIVAKLLGANDFGVFSLGLTVITIMSTVSRFGLDFVVLKNVAINHEANPKVSQGYYLSSITFLTFIGLVLTILFITFSDVIANHIFSEPSLGKVLRILAISIVPISVVYVTAEYLKAIGKQSISSVFQGLMVPLIFLMLCIVIFFENKVALDNIAFSYTVSTIATGIMVYFVWRKSKINLKSEAFHWKKLAINGWPFFVVGSSALLMSWTDILVLGIFSTSESVGVYSLAAKIVLAINFILIIVNSINAPRFAKLYSEGKIDVIKLIVRKTSYVLIFFSIIIGLVISLYSEWIIGSFGDDYSLGSIILIILVIGQVINVSCGSVSVLLAVTNHEKKLSHIFMITALINLTISVSLVNTFGVIGVAIATLLCQIIWNVWSMVEVRNKLGFWTISFSN